MTYHEEQIPATFTTTHKSTECTHGHDDQTEALVDEDGRSSCCGAMTSIFSDDGSEYCKCCYGTIVGGYETETVRNPDPVNVKRFAYKALAISNDYNAVRKGRVGRRILRRAYGRATGRLARRIFG